MFRQKVRKTLSERFWEKVQKTRGCWLWTANCTKDAEGNRRYGLIGAGRRGEGMLYAHRVSWELHNGPIPEGMMVLHTCDNTQCVKPSHLFLGTQSDNMQDMIRKGRQGKTGPKAGYGAKVNLTDTQIRALRSDSTFMGYSELALKYGIGVGAARNIVLGLSCYRVI